MFWHWFLFFFQWFFYFFCGTPWKIILQTRFLLYKIFSTYNTEFFHDFSYVPTHTLCVFIGGFSLIFLRRFHRCLLEFRFSNTFFCSPIFFIKCWCSVESTCSIPWIFFHKCVFYKSKRFHTHCLTLDIRL